MSSTMMISKRFPDNKFSSTFTKTTKITSNEDRSTKSKNISSDSMIDMEISLNQMNQPRSYHFNFKERIDTHSDSDEDKKTQKSDNSFNFHKADVVGEGPLSQVLKAVDLKTGKYYALKIFKIPP